LVKKGRNERKENQSKLNDRVNILRQSRGKIHATIGAFFFCRIFYSLRSTIFFGICSSLPHPLFPSLLFNRYISCNFIIVIIIIIIIIIGDSPTESLMPLSPFRHWG